MPGDGRTRDSGYIAAPDTWVARFALAINDFLAIRFSVDEGSPRPKPSYFLKGNPKSFNKNLPSSSVGALVTMVMFIPLTLSILS